jgi:hypothetical protein
MWRRSTKIVATAQIVRASFYSPHSIPDKDTPIVHKKGLPSDGKKKTDSTLAH